MEGDPRLSVTAVDLLIDPLNELLLTPASYWELANKIAIGKYQLTDPSGMEQVPLQHFSKC